VHRNGDVFISLIPDSEPSEKMAKKPTSIMLYPMKFKDAMAELLRVKKEPKKPKLKKSPESKDNR
jgi:hypothetical protein